MNGVQGGVGDGQLAAATTGTVTGHVRLDVGRAADTAVVLAHTPPELHPTVASRSHHDHLATARAARLEPLPLAIVRRRRLCTVRTHVAVH